MPLLRSGRAMIRGADHGWLEYLGGQGFIFGTKNLVSVITDVGLLTNIKFYIYLSFVLLIFVFALIYLGSLTKRALH